jgi:hypothetical protein
VKTGDLVCHRGTAEIGVVLELMELEAVDHGAPWHDAAWAFVLWPSDGKSLEKTRDLEVIHNP